MGRIIEPTAYGMPSKLESQVSRRRTDVFVNRQNWSDWSTTPLQDQLGIVNPNGLLSERHHAGVPDIDPDKHILVIHGKVKQPLKFSMSDLMRQNDAAEPGDGEIAPEPTGHGLPLGKCEAYNRVYDQSCGSS